MKLKVTQVYELILFVFLACVIVGCDQVGDAASGAGRATTSLANKILGEKSPEQDEGAPEEQTNRQTSSGVIGESKPESAEESVDEESSEAETAITEVRTGEFDLVFEMSYQSCASCGIWFDSAELVIEHSEGRFTAQQSGSLLIKEAPYHQGRFNANISSIPSSSTIESATLYMHLNRHEGISNDDFTSTISVYGKIDGSMSYIREITARDDIKGQGYSKANPVVPIDFTDYARRI
ncbi:MAG: hypothetical protein QNI91_10370 [Arenicellales bacterium]|nr:hypothetical protein [Arenicellales bacterium]